MSDTTSKTNGGVNFLGLLFITFLVLKLTHVIDWSWWWVTAPLWGGLAILAVIGIIALLIFLIGFLRFKFMKRK